MDTIPLTDPKGEVMAYACSNCGAVHSNDKNLEFAKDQADRCCVCRDCGAESEEHYYICASCKKKAEEEWKAGKPERDREYAEQKRLLEESLTKAKDKDVAKYLRDRMSEISESHYCAGWMADLEFSLWDMMTGGDREFGFFPVDEHDIQHLRELSEKAGGWWAWEKDQPASLFRTFAEWDQICKAKGPR